MHWFPFAMLFLVMLELQYNNKYMTYQQPVLFGALTGFFISMRRYEALRPVEKKHQLLITNFLQWTSKHLNSRWIRSQRNQEETWRWRRGVMKMLSLISLDNISFMNIYLIKLSNHRSSYILISVFMERLHNESSYFIG